MKKPSPPSDPRPTSPKPVDANRGFQPKGPGAGHQPTGNNVPAKPPSGGGSGKK